MIEIRILGSPSLLGHEGQDVRSVVHQPRRLALLSYLTLSSHGSYLRRDRLLALFWPKSPEKKARSSLSEALSRLRQSLGNDVILTRGTDEVGVAAGAIWCDALELRRAVDESRWSAVAELYRGPLLDGLLLDGLHDFELWLGLQRNRLARAALDALAKLAEAAIANGDDSALAWAERAHQVDPLDSGAVRRVMRLLARSGHRAAALDLYDEFVARLDRDRGMTASSETVELVEQIKKGWPGGSGAKHELGLAVRAREPSAEDQRPEGVEYRPQAETGFGQPTATAPARLRVPLTVGFAVATVVLAMTLALAALRPRPVPRLGVPTRAEVTGLNVAGGGRRVAISPDGRWLVATHTEEGSSRLLYVRRADESEWRPIPNTEEASNPTFSPDGRAVAFSASGGIWTVPVTGGTALPVTVDGRHAHWGLNDTIVYVDSHGVLYSVAATGGRPKVLLDSDTLFIRQPHLLPNGKAVAFSTRTNGDPLNSRILLLEVETGDVRELVASGNEPHYVPTGHLIYGHGDGTLMGIAFDLDRLETSGAPKTLLPDLTVNEAGYTVFSVSQNGTLFYGSPHTDPSGSPSLVWVDLEGSETQLPTRRGSPRTPRVSPDGGRVAYEAGRHIWVYDEATGANTQLTFEGRNVTPIWSKDGEFIYFLSERAGTQGLDGFKKAADGATEAEQLWAGGDEASLTSIDPEGEWLVLAEWKQGQRYNVVLGSTGPHGGSFSPYIANEWLEYEGAISPDGRWMAYTSYELGAQMVFVRDFPEGQGMWQVSEGLGHDPVWAPDGSALYFVSGLTLMKVEVFTEGSARFGRPIRLYPFPYDPAGTINIGYDIHPDGDRFVVQRGGGTVVRSIHLVTNWFEELKRLVPN